MNDRRFLDGPSYSVRSTFAGSQRVARQAEGRVARQAAGGVAQVLDDRLGRSVQSLDYGAARRYTYSGLDRVFDAYFARVVERSGSCREHHG
jgi:hypothetical protein